MTVENATTTSKLHSMNQIIFLI